MGENGANWVHQDANWNIIGTTTSTGQVAERYTYDPYGRLRARRLTGFGDTDADGLVGSKDVGDWEDTQGEGGVYDRKLDANLDGVNDAYDAAAFDKTVSLPGGRLTVPNRRFSPSEQWAGYTARTLDPESGLMHYRLRAYSPELRRFGQRDPIGYAGGGPELYEYVNGNPWAYVDPFGEHALGDSPSLDTRNEGIVALRDDEKAGLAVAGGCSVVAGALLVGAAAAASGPIEGAIALGWRGTAVVIASSVVIGVAGKSTVGTRASKAGKAVGKAKSRGSGGGPGGRGSGTAGTSGSGSAGGGSGGGGNGGQPSPPPPKQPSCKTGGKGPSDGLSAAVRSAGSLEEALKRARKSAKSKAEQVRLHEQKLADYRANPYAHDNLGHLKNAPNPQAVIDTRIEKLEWQISNFKKQVAEHEALIAEAESLLKGGCP